MLYVSNKNIKKIISIIISCTLFLPSIYLASEHESTEQKKQTKYDLAKKLIKGAIEGYGTYLGGSVAHEFGHWSVGKIIHKCNGFFYVHPSGTGGTWLYYDPTTKDLVKDIVIKAYLNKDHKLPPLKFPQKKHPLMHAAGPLFGIGYNLLVQRMALQSCINNKNFNMLWGVFGTHLSLASDIYNFSPFASNSDGNRIFQYFNKDCPPHKLADIGFQALAVSAALMLGVWNIKAVLPSAAS